jgi:predicted PurR-regulated permease PerM
VAEPRRVTLTPGLVSLVVTVLLLWLAGSSSSILLLFFVSVLLAVYLDALTDYAERYTRLKRPYAFAIAMVVSLLLITGLVALLAPPVVDQTRQLITKLPEYATTWQAWLKQLVERFPALGPALGDENNPGQVVDVALGEAKQLAGALVPKVFNLLHGFIDLAAVAVMAIYLSLHPHEYRKLVISLFPPRHRPTVSDVLGTMGRTLRAWLMAQIAAMAVLGFLTAVGLYLLNVPYWLAFGIFSGVAAIVPFFGTLVSTILPALFVLGGDSPLRVFAVLALGIIVHLIEGNFVAPLIFQRGVHLPPVLSILSVLIVGKLLGPIGLLVAVPTLAIVMVVIRKVVQKRIYGDELSEKGH